MNDTTRWLLIVGILVGAGVLVYGLDGYTKRYGSLFSGPVTFCSRLFAALLVLGFAAFVVWHAGGSGTVLLAFWLIPVIVPLVLYALGLDSQRLRRIQKSKESTQIDEVPNDPQ